MKNKFSREELKLLPIILTLLIMSGSLLLMSCSYKYFPMESEIVQISDDFGIVENSEFFLAVNNDYWAKDPQELTDYFSTFFITFKNKKNEKIEFSENDLILVDDDGVQYDIVPIEDVMSLLIPDEVYFQQFSLIDEQDDVFEQWQDSKSNLMKYSFNFGNIQAGNRKQGYIFFQKLSPDNLKCKIIYKDYEINFRRDE